jgi:hypothetical protein
MSRSSVSRADPWAVAAASPDEDELYLVAGENPNKSDKVGHEIAPRPT